MPWGEKEAVGGEVVTISACISMLGYFCGSCGKIS
jgi:hypothetical protein